MSVAIRAFERDDYEQAWRFWTVTEGVGLSGADSAENIGRYLDRNPGLSLVAVDGPAIVATILCGHDGRRGLIHHLAVAPSHRRQGLARALVSRALEALREAGIEKCHLLVFRENAAGCAFWERIGAEQRHTLTTFSLST